MKKLNSNIYIIFAVLIAFFQPIDIIIIMNSDKDLGYLLGTLFGIITTKFLGLIFILLFIFGISYVIDKKTKYNIKFLFSRISFFVFLLLWVIQTLFVLLK